MVHVVESVVNALDASQGQCMSLPHQPKAALMILRGAWRSEPGGGSLIALPLETARSLCAGGLVGCRFLAAAGGRHGLFHEADFIRRQAIEAVNPLVNFALPGRRVRGSVCLLGFQDAVH
jgi:hypothetical protein